jgi:hypothetical protein
MKYMLIILIAILTFIASFYRGRTDKYNPTKISIENQFYAHAILGEKHRIR